jgi:hypothetical protein
MNETTLVERFGEYINGFVIPKSISDSIKKLVSMSELITPNISDDSLRVIFISSYIKAHHIARIRISFDMVERIRKALEE